MIKGRTISPHLPEHLEIGDHLENREVWISEKDRITEKGPEVFETLNTQIMLVHISIPGDCNECLLYFLMAADIGNLAKNPKVKALYGYHN